MPAEPLPAFCLGVVGPPAEGSGADRLWAWLDAVVLRHRAEHRVCLLTFAGGPAADWGRDRSVPTTLVPRGAGGDPWAKRDMEMVAAADAILVVGDAGPWRRLVRLAAEAKVPVRFFPLRSV